MTIATYYPARPKVFACKFVRRMGKVCLANDIGPDACWLLAFIVSTEDAKGYRAAVSFYNEDLATRTGLSIAGMKRARQKAIDAGWLHHEPGAKGRAARYWVLVPAWADEMDDAAGDEEPGELSGGMSAQAEPVSGQQMSQNIGSGAMSAQAEPVSGRQAAEIRPKCEPPSSFPFPYPSSPSADAEDGATKKESKSRPKAPNRTSADPRFVKFWAAYPRKVKKADAAKAFAKLNPDAATLEAIHAALVWQTCSEQWQSDDGKYIPHPSTWLNSRRWEDEPPRSLSPPTEPPRIKRAEDNPLAAPEAAAAIYDPM